MAATTMTIAAITAVAATAAGAVVEGVANYEQNNYAQREAEINAAQAKEAKKQTYQEESLNATQRYRAGRHDLATGANLLAGMGNLGTSAESAYREGAFNLAEDLSALKHKYDTVAAKYGTQAKMYKENAKMYEHNKFMGILASSIKGVGSTAMATLAAGSAAGWGAGGGKPRMRTIYGDAIDPGQVASANNLLGV